jgi:lysophospholipase L1-like esterase
VLAAVALDAAGLPQMAHTLAQVRSLTDLFGSNPAPAVPPAGPPLTDVQAVVIGDSTAAGDGNPLVNSPTTQDRLCHRSRDSYAADLAATTGWKVLNLACSGATIDSGVMGVQSVGDQALAPQVAILKQAQSVKYVFVSIGANDLQMGALVGVCVAVHECNDPAQAALFQAELDAFTRTYSQLLTELAALPSKPTVIINLYYDGLGNGACASKILDASSVAFLRSWFNAMNTTLADGAQLHNFVTAQPNFSGHQYCDAHPYIQDLSSTAPLHPNVAGGLTIALADLQAVYSAGSGT